MDKAIMKSSCPLIALIDMDCFYVQVELNDAPEYKDKPSAVVQYNAWKGGGIIAVSYEARACGVSRSMRGDEAKSKCPDIKLFTVPESRGKADLTKYRNAGANVIKCLSKHAKLIERASIDEAYIDLSDEVDKLMVNGKNSVEMDEFWNEIEKIDGLNAVGFPSFKDWINEVKNKQDFDDDIRLAVATWLVKKMRDSIWNELRFRCSAGVGISKTIAKYLAGLNKPNGQTVIPTGEVFNLLKDAPIDKIRNLGGKTGAFVQEKLGISTMGQLFQYSFEELIKLFGEKTGSWLYGLARGEDAEGVISRQLAQSVGCSKRFPGGSRLHQVEQVKYWLQQLSDELWERLESIEKQGNARVPTHLSVAFRNTERSGTRVVPFPSQSLVSSSTSIVQAVFVTLQGINEAGPRGLATSSWEPPIVALGLSAGRFRPIPQQTSESSLSKYLIDVPVETLASTSSTASNLPFSKFTTKQEPTETIINDSKLPNKTGFFSKYFQKQSEEKLERMEKFKRLRGIKPESIKSEPISKNKEYLDICQDSIESPIFETPEHLDPFDNSVSPKESKAESFGYGNPSNNCTPLISTIAKSSEIMYLCQDSQESQFSEFEESKFNANISKDPEDYIYCDKCTKKILVWEMPEHNDYHVAQNVQRELCREIAAEDERNRKLVKEKNSELIKNNNRGRKRKQEVTGNISITQFMIPK